jgi:hypothetical protein
LSGKEEIARFEALAEEAYAGMYDAHRPKEHAEDALLNMQRAIDAAAALGLKDEAQRLTERRDHIQSVYNHQFRWVR